MDSDSDDMDDGKHGDVADKFKSAKKAMKKSKMSRDNIIDLVDTMVRRMRITTDYGSIFRNFCLKNFICCKHSPSLHTDHFFPPK